MGDFAATDSYPPIPANSTSPALPALAKSPSPPAAHLQPSQRETLIRELACHVNLIIAGWADASSGPLIPYIQAHYGLTYEVVSLLFIGSMAGSMIGALSNGHLAVKFGMGKVITAGAVIQGIGYCFLVPAFNFPSFPVVYGVVGMGAALQDAQANTFVASLPNPTHRLSWLHASYGLGAVVCPLAATAFASSGIKFSYFYSISVGLTFVNIGILLWAFKFNYRIPQDEVAVGGGAAEQAGGIELRPLGNADDAEKNTPPASSVVARAPSVNGAAIGEEEAQTEVAPVGPKRGMLGEVLRMTQLWLFACFIVLYVGAEVSTGGWVVTFLQQERGGGESAGYAATGFWGGLLVGRLVLSSLTVRVGEKRIMFVYLGLAFALEFAVWFADSLVGNAVTVGLIGFFMGPAYPMVITVASRVLPRRLHSTAIGFIAAFGQLGSALFPFCTGALAQATSPVALQPVMIVLLAGMLAIWALVRDAPKKVE